MTSRFRCPKCGTVFSKSETVPGEIILCPRKYCRAIAYTMAKLQIEPESVTVRQADLFGEPVSQTFDDYGRLVR